MHRSVEVGQGAGNPIPAPFIKDYKMTEDLNVNLDDEFKRTAMVNEDGEPEEFYKDDPIEYEPELTKDVDFPAEILPIFLREYCDDIIGATGFDRNMVYATAQAMTSCCARKHFVLNVNDNRKTYPNSYTWITANPGAGKSPVLNFFMKTIEDKEAEYISNYNVQMFSYLNLLGKYETDMSIIKRKLSTDTVDNDPAAKAKWDKKLLNLMETKPEKPKKRKIKIDNFTTESAEIVIEENDETIQLITDEGRTAIRNLLGAMRKDAAMDINLLCKGYDGSSVETIRISRKPVSIRECILSSLLMMQPDCWQEFIANRESITSGLDARIFNINVPLQRRDGSKRDLCIFAKHEYEKQTKKIIDQIGLVEFHFSEEAKENFNRKAAKMQDVLFNMQKKKYVNERLVNFYSKFENQFLKLVCRLQIYEWLRNGSVKVSESTVNKAALEYRFYNHQKRKIILTGNHNDVDISKNIILEFLKNNIDKFQDCGDYYLITYTPIIASLRRHGYNNKKSIDPVMAALVDHAWLTHASVVDKEVKWWEGKYALQKRDFYRLQPQAEVGQE